MSEWKEWLGKRSTSEAELQAAQANGMAVMLDRPPIFQTGDELPPAWHWLFFHDLVRASDLGPDGHPKLGLVLPPVPLPRRMWASGSLTFYTPLRLGDTVQKSSVIRSITAKEGRTGLLYFVTVEHTLSTTGMLNLIEEQCIVYREAARATQPSKAQAAPTDADYWQSYTLDNTTLFRYSALTFNGHRIHYDVDYCRLVEGYPNLVIHGPLIATLLLNLYHQQRQPLTWFRYRAQSPLFLPRPFTVNGKSTTGGARLWASNDEGGLAMEAEAG
jgi:3-methylfumaryl-CoA hydratase